MAEQVHKEKQKQVRKQGDSSEEEVVDLTNEELSESVIDLLDEIDEVLEVNAEEFVRCYVQKGGE